MAFDVNNFVVDHVIRGIMVNKLGEFRFGINQITDPSLSITSDTNEAVDALGSPIAIFDRNKRATFSANNSIFDLGLYAAQNGTEKVVASATNKIVSPAFETIDIEKDMTKVTLKNAPIDPITEIHVLKGDGAMGTRYTVSSSAGDSTFVYSAETHEITLPTGVKPGQSIFVMYNYETDEAVSVECTAVDFPKEGQFIMEVLGTDVCDPTTLIHAYIVFPNAKLDANVDVSFTTDGNHPFSIICQQSYCDKKKRLFKIVIPNEE